MHVNPLRPARHLPRWLLSGAPNAPWPDRPGGISPNMLQALPSPKTEQRLPRDCTRPVPPACLPAPPSACMRFVFRARSRPSRPASAGSIFGWTVYEVCLQVDVRRQGVWRHDSTTGTCGVKTTESNTANYSSPLAPQWSIMAAKGSRNVSSIGRTICNCLFSHGSPINELASSLWPPIERARYHRVYTC